MARLLSGADLRTDGERDLALPLLERLLKTPGAVFVLASFLAARRIYRKYFFRASRARAAATLRKRASNLPESDWRSRDVEFQDPKLSRNLALVERLREVGEHHGRPPGQIAIAWTLQNPVVTGAIVGARNARQVEGNVGAAELRLTDEEITKIEGKNVNEPESVTAT
jgi:aryl-alcohol dehydrogenase-like predicted oxidoreductase